LTAVTSRAVAYRDRIYRFTYDIIEHILKKHGAKIEVENHDQHVPEQELAEDVVSIIIIFGARLYGSRSGKARKAAAGAAAGSASASGASGASSSGGAAGVGGKRRGTASGFSGPQAGTPGDTYSSPASRESRARSPTAASGTRT